MNDRITIEGHDGAFAAYIARPKTFLIDYFHNGYLHIFDSVTNERLSHKSAFVPVNIDSGATIEFI